MKAFVVPLVFYFMALMGLCIEFLPESALAIFGGRSPGDTKSISSVFVVVFGGLGALLHWFLYWRDPEHFDSAMMTKVGVGMVVVLGGLFGLSMFLSVSTGASPEQLERSTSTFISVVGLSVVVGIPLLMIGAAVASFMLLRFHPLNRMNRKLQIENYSAAIAIGERTLRKSDSAAIRLNLALAYAAGGQVEQAGAIYDDLTALEEPPEPFTAEAYAEAIELLRMKLEECRGAQ